MTQSLREQIERINVRLAELLQATKSSLRGQRSFGVEEVREIQGPVNEMATLLEEANTVRCTAPEIDEQVTQYKTQLRDLQQTLDQVNVMLLARRASLEASRAQLAAANQWLSACQQTR